MKAFLKTGWPFVAALVLFAVFKSLYPYPDLFLDSINYLQWGLDDYPIAFRPLGYTRFLLGTKDLLGAEHFTLVFIQFAVHVGAAVFFCRTLFRIWPLVRWQRAVCYALTLFNPLAWFLFNLLNPDSLFISLSAVWVASLLRFAFVPGRKWGMLALNLAAFVCLFHLRYNALYYPFFGAAAVFLAAWKLRDKLVFAASGLAVFGVLYTGALHHAEEQVGEARLSGFGGWAMANNALHVYYGKGVDSSIWDDPEEQALDRLVRATIDSVPRTPGTPTDQFLWTKTGPLKQYLFAQLAQGRYTDYMQGWWQISGFYNEFGTKLIKHYPGAFFTQFFGPNLRGLFFPPPETLQQYDVFGLTLSPEQAAFLGYTKSGPLPERVPGLLQHTVQVWEGLHAVLTALTILAAFLLAGLYLRTLRRKGPVADPRPAAGAVLAGFYLVTVLLLTFAHPILLRYVAFALVYFSPLPLLCWNQWRSPKSSSPAA